MMVLELTQSIAHHLWLTRAEIFSSPGSTLVVQEGFWRRKVFAPRVHGLSGTPHLQDFAVATLALCASDSHQEGASICTVHCCAKDTGCTTAKMGLCVFIPVLIVSAFQFWVFTERLRWMV